MAMTFERKTSAAASADLAAKREKADRWRVDLIEALPSTIKELLADSSVAEVDINDDGRVFAERLGEKSRTEDTGLRFSAEESESIAVALAAAARVTLTEPCVHGKVNFSDKEFVRVAITSPLDQAHVEQHAIAIRKHRSVVKRLRHWLDDKEMTPAIYEAAGQVVADKVNFLIGGPMFGGKTTFFNGLNAEAADNDPTLRQGYVEDVREYVCPFANKKSVLATREFPVKYFMPHVWRWNLRSFAIPELRDGSARETVKLWAGGLIAGGATMHASEWRQLLRRFEALVLDAQEGPLQRDMIAAAIGAIITINWSHTHGRQVTGVYRLKNEPSKDGEYVLTSRVETPWPPAAGRRVP